MKLMASIALVLVNLSFAVISNDIERTVGFEFIKYSIEVEVKHWSDDAKNDKEFGFKSSFRGEITNSDPTAFLVGIDSVGIDSEVDPLCGCLGCYSKVVVDFFGLNHKRIQIEYGACGGNFEEARFRLGKKKYIIHYSEEQAKKIRLVFESLAKEGLKEMEVHFTNE